MATPTSGRSARSPTSARLVVGPDRIEVIDSDPRDLVGQPVRDQGGRRDHDAPVGAVALEQGRLAVSRGGGDQQA